MQSGDERKLGDKTAITLGYKWDLEEDTMGSTMEISLISKRRGQSQRKKLEEVNENPSMITRRSLSVLSASIVSTDGILSAPLQIGAKLLLSRASQLLPGVDSKFVQDCLEYINSVTDY